MTVLQAESHTALNVSGFELADLKISSLRAAYQQGLKPSALIAALLPRLAIDSHGIWIQQVDAAWLLDYATQLDAKNPADLPLYGIPFAIKDNIDLAGVPTTAACPDFSYVPQQSATVVQKLLDAGVQPQETERIDGEAKFTGQSFVFTGTLSMNRREAEETVKQLGGRISGSVPKKTNYVVVGEDAGSKADRARELGVTILSEEEFKELIES